MSEADPNAAPQRSGFLLGPWQLVTLVLVAPWLLIILASGGALSRGERWLLVGLCGSAIVILLVVFSRNLVFVGERSLWIPGRGRVAWGAVVSVRIEEIDVRISPIEAPVLRLDVPVHKKGPGSREQLTGLAGYRFTRGNQRVWRQANLICRSAGLPPLPFVEEPPPDTTPRRARLD